MEYQIEYCTENTYDEPVTDAIYELLVLPCNDETQQISDINVTNSLNEDAFVYKNVFGYDVLRFRSIKPFQNFRFCISAKVKKNNEGKQSYVSSLPLDEEIAILESGDFFVENNLFLTSSHYTTITSKKENTILNYDKSKSVVEYLLELNSYLFNLIEYDSESTTVRTTADEVLDLKKGVCQDFAHVFIAMTRKNGIPARYVSGYLNQGKSFKGASYMHAWAEVLIPGTGWMGFDPSNNLVADHLFIKVADGVDYSDCSPIRGVIKTSGTKHTSNHAVLVQQ